MWGRAVHFFAKKAISPQATAALEAKYGLDKPLYQQYFTYITDALHGDFGDSLKQRGRTVTSIILMKFPVSARVGGVSVLTALLIGIPLGILSAKKQNTIIDNISMVLSLIGVSMPNFWFGLLVVMLFALKLGWLPSQGMGEGFVPLLQSLVLPALTLGTGSAGTIARMTRSSMLEVIRQDYISTARSKGVDERTVTYQHMLRNALIPIITAVGLQFGTLLGGAMLTETVFSWPGLGRLMVENIKSKDIPMVLGCVVFLATMFTIVNLVVDIIYAFVDPRIKSLYKKGR